MPEVGATSDGSPERSRGLHKLHLTLKRVLDVVGASSALLLASPAMVAVAAAIRLRMGSPVLLRQVRVGLDERTFKLFKFRTMTDDRGADGKLLPDGERLTSLGRFLRRCSLDELPQLFNVLSGSMSLVGPRPLITRYVPRYTARQRLRHCVKPGITGLAQISGRNALDWETRLEYDVKYAETFSFWLDIKILALTVLPVASGVRPDVADGLDGIDGGS